MFGTIDQASTFSAGAIGFSIEAPWLVEYEWTPADELYGHRGNHLAYLGGRWQAAKLLPALDPALTAAELRRRWAQPCKEN